MKSLLSRRGAEQNLERRAFLALQDVLDDPHSAQRCHPEEAKLTKDLAPSTGADPGIPADPSAARCPSAVGAAALGSPEAPPCLKGGAPVRTLGRGDTSFPLCLPLEDSDLHIDICACEKNLGQIRIGHGADSPKACVVLRSYRRDVREAVPCDGDRRCGWDREIAPQPLRHRLAGDRR